MKYRDNGPIPRILCVDNKSQFTRVLQKALLAQGYLVFIAADGVEGMVAAHDWRPDIVLVEVILPKMNGIEFCRQLRAISEVPIIMVSARSGEQTKIDALDAGADDNVTKPFSVLELAARVRVQLRRHPPNRSGSDQTLIVGDFRIDVGHHRVSVRSQSIRLTPLQFDLLLCFVKHDGQILSHRTIFHVVWGLDENRPEHIRVYVAQLRKKIESTEDPRYLRTEPSLGYRFCANGESAI